MWRVDYAAAGHPTWLSLESESFADVPAAIRGAQNKLDRWEKCVGWRVVPLAEPTFQKITDEHVGQIVVEGRRVYPWSLEPMPPHVWPEDREKMEAA